MKTRSLGLAFAALLAFAPERGSAKETAGSAAPSNSTTPARDSSDRPASVLRAPIVPKTSEATEARPRRYARTHLRRHAYWDEFPIYWPSYHRHHLGWRRIAWLGWF